MISLLVSSLYLYKGNIQNVFGQNITLPELSAPPKTYVTIDEKKVQVIDNYQPYRAILPQYLDIIKNESNSDLKEEAIYQVGTLYFSLRKYAEAEKYLKEVNLSGGQKMVRLLDMLNHISAHNDQPEKIVERIKNYKTRITGQDQIILNMWQAYALKKMGDKDKASNIIEKLQNKDLEDKLASRFKTISWHLEEGRGIILGQVINTGTLKPISNLPVYLYPTGKVETLTANPYIPMVLTDKGGRFKFTGLPAGEYNIGVEIERNMYSKNVKIAKYSQGRIKMGEGDMETVRFEMVPAVQLTSKETNRIIKYDDAKQVKFEWQEYPGAEYYKLIFKADFEGKNELPLKFYGFNGKRYKQPHAIVDFKDGIKYIHIENYQFRQSIPPQAVIGWVFPGSKFEYVIKAFDRNNNLLAQSSRFGASQKNIIEFEEGRLRPADKMVIEGNYHKAYKQYLERLEKDPDPEIGKKFLSLFWHLKLKGEIGFEEVKKDLNGIEVLPENLELLLKCTTFNIPEMQKTIKLFLKGKEIKESPAAWEHFFKKSIKYLDQDRLSEVVEQVKRGGYKPISPKENLNSLTDLVCALLYHWSNDPDYRKYKSPQFSQYQNAISNYETTFNIKQFFDLLSQSQ